MTTARYDDLLNKPFEAITTIYKHLQIELTEKQIYQYLSSSPSLINKLQDWIISLKLNSKMPISVEEFGLEKEEVEKSLAEYIKDCCL